MKTSGRPIMPKTADTASAKQITDLQNKVKRLNERIDGQKDLGTRLSETLHSLQVHREELELRTQNEDLIAALSINTPNTAGGRFC